MVTEGMDYMTWNFLKKAEMCKYRIPEFPTVPHLNSADGDVEYYPEIGKRELSGEHEQQRK